MHEKVNGERVISRLRGATIGRMHKKARAILCKITTKTAVFTTL